jgi:hypothetical protein
MVARITKHYPLSQPIHFLRFCTVRLSHPPVPLTVTISIINLGKPARRFGTKMAANETTDNNHEMEFVVTAVAHVLPYNLYSLERER